MRSRPNNAATIAATLGVLLIAAPALGQVASFQGLGELPGAPSGASSRADAVSADGSVVVGAAGSTSGLEAFSWTQAGGMVSLGELPGGVFESRALAVSGDGSTVAGSSLVASGEEAFRWTTGSGIVGLGDFPGGFFGSQALGVSADGSIVVGFSFSTPGIQAFRWTQAGGMVGLGDLPGGQPTSRANAISADGSIVVGQSGSASGNEAFRWTQAGGMVGIGDLPGGFFRSEAFAVSADGSVVVGQSRSASGDEAFRWTQAGGMVGLGDLPGGNFDGEALAVSADGSVVVGRSATAASSREAFIWDAANGMRALKVVLVNDFGLDLTGWLLEHATGISADGMTIVGRATIIPAFQTAAWIAQLAAPPSAGDLTGRGGLPDGCVDGTDLAVLLGAWCSAAGDADPKGDPGDPPCEGCPMGFELADIAGPGFGPPDGCVDGNDLALLLGEWCSVAGGNPCGTCGP